MTKIIGVNEWSEVTLLEDGDKLSGGEDGLANAQAKSLVNRTIFLKEELLKVKEDTAGSSGKDGVDGPPGPTGPPGPPGVGGTVGDLYWRYYLKENEIKANGALLSRTEYGNLWKFANDRGLVVTEAQWSAGLYGLYSVGNGSTTFRIPDLRGVVIRGLDDGRGFDGGRVLGSYQGDAFGAHKHTSGVRTSNNIYGTNGTASGTQSGIDVNGSSNRASPYTSTDGGTETRPKNIALYACIQFE